MARTRCIPCGGSGRVMGGGMLLTDCDHCDGAGKVSLSPEEINLDSIKKTDGYKKAKKRLKSKNPDLSEEDAENLLDEAFEKEKPKIEGIKNNG